MRSSETLMLQDVWRKAYREPDGLALSFKTKSGATRARMQLYNAVKGQKSGKTMDDLELVHAAESLEIVWEGETTLRIRRRDKSDMIETLSEVLGKRLEDYVDPEVEKSLERSLAELERLRDGAPSADGVAGHQDNPFYGKRG